MAIMHLLYVQVLYAKSDQDGFPSKVQVSMPPPNFCWPCLSIVYRTVKRSSLQYIKRKSYPDCTHFNGVNKQWHGYNQNYQYRYKEQLLKICHYFTYNSAEQVPSLHTVNNILMAMADTCGPGSTVGIAPAYRLGGPGIESQWGWDFLHLSRPALRPIQPPVQWVPGLS